jgi:hypothetical protein
MKLYSLEVNGRAVTDSEGDIKYFHSEDAVFKYVKGNKLQREGKVWIYEYFLLDKEVSFSLRQEVEHKPSIH